MDGNHAPHSNQHQPSPERDGSFSYDIESMDGGGGGGLRGAASEALLRFDDDDGGPREPLLRKRTMNTTSQIAIVGANVFPIESLDYE
jgi:chloride channel 7